VAQARSTARCATCSGGGGNLIAGSVLLWLIWPGLSDASLIAEVVALALLLGCALGALLSREKKP